MPSHSFNHLPLRTMLASATLRGWSRLSGAPRQYSVVCPCGSALAPMPVECQGGRAISIMVRAFVIVASSKGFS